MFSAINPRGMSPADQSRISMFELLMHDNNREVAMRIAEDEAYFRSTGSAWCSHMIRLAHLVQPAADAIDIHLTGDRRHRQNMSILIGAGFVALNGRVPDDDEAKALAAEYAPAVERHALEVHRDDAQECLDHLLSHVVDGYPLGHWLACLRDGQLRRGNDFTDAERIIMSYGLRVNAEGDAAGFYIANGAPAMDEVFRGTPWGQRAWERALRKLEDAFIPPNPVQFKVLGKKRAIGIPLAYLPEEPLPFAAHGPILGRQDGRTFLHHGRGRGIHLPPPPPHPLCRCRGAVRPSRRPSPAISTPVRVESELHEPRRLGARNVPANTWLHGRFPRRRSERLRTATCDLLVRVPSLCFPSSFAMFSEA